MQSSILRSTAASFSWQLYDRAAAEDGDKCDHKIKPEDEAITDGISMLPPYLHLATSEMWCWSGGRGMLK